jgi:hypothetical protein
MYSCPPKAPAEPGVPQLLQLSAATQLVLMAIRDGNTKAQCEDEVRLITIEDKVSGLKTNQHLHIDALYSKMDNLLQKMDMTWTKNTVLREAYHTSREETAMLKAAVDSLTKKLDKHTTISTPPSPGTATTSTAMEEMTMQLSHVQNDIQDILAAVRNRPGKRKPHMSRTCQRTKFPHPPTRDTEQTSEHTRAAMQTRPPCSGPAPPLPLSSA